MAAIKYKVNLTESERSRLNEVSRRGKTSVRTVKRALALLQADEGLRDREIAGVLLINAPTEGLRQPAPTRSGVVPCCVLSPSSCPAQRPQTAIGARCDD